MNLGLQVREAFANLTAAKLRSFLAILGILVGTGSVVAMVSGGQLATREALKQFEELGTDLLSVSMYAEQSEGDSKSKELTVADTLAISKEVPEVLTVAPYTSAYKDLSFNGRSLDGSIIGTTSSLAEVIKITMKEGRFISELDKYAPYCVIGAKLADELRRQGVLNPLGKQINLGKEIYTIIGVANPWKENSFFNQDVNRSVIVTADVALLMSKYSTLNNIVMRLQDGANIETVQTEIEAYIKKVAPQLNLFFRSPKQLIDSMTNQRQTMTLLLGLIGSISLLVGGIGVMNIMLVSVVERKREIGIRMAVGARRRDIQLLFLVESVALTVFGGLVGVCLGILTSYIIALFAGWDFVIFLVPPTIGFFVSVAIGIFFGFYPAYQASCLDPIQTLRSD